MPVSAEGRVENKKLNQTAALLSFGSVFGFQLDSLEKHLITLTVFTFTEDRFSTVYYVLGGPKFVWLKTHFSCRES